MNTRCDYLYRDGSNYSDPGTMASAWHRDPGEHFDFALGPQRIEVKSSSYRRREHYFSLEQLAPAGASRIVVASVFVERTGGGVSLQKIFEDTRGLLAENISLATRFDAVFYRSLGSGWADAMDEWNSHSSRLRFTLLRPCRE